MTRLEALQASVTRWKNLVIATDPRDIRLGSRECALCTLYIDWGCEDCPIYQTTGEPFCGASIFTDAQAAHWRWLRDPYCKPQWETEAGHFLEFLEGLLEAEMGLSQSE